MEPEIDEIAPSTYFPGGHTSRAEVLAKLAEVGSECVLGAIYYKDNDTPEDVQLGFSETGKHGETSGETAERGLIEEAGLKFREDAKMEWLNPVRQGRATCQRLLVRATDVIPATPAACRAYHGRFDQPDDRSRKSLVIVHGTRDEICDLISRIRFKPQKYNRDTREYEYYDANIKGISCVTLG